MIPVASTRRAFLAALAAIAAANAATTRVGFSYGTYGLKMLPWDKAFELIAKTGYDGVEICTIPDYPTEPRTLSVGDRKAMKGKLTDLGLRVPAFLDTLRVMDAKQTHQKNLDLVKQAIDFGADISPGKPPILETILGRKTEEWDQIKQEMAQEVGEWAEIASKGRMTICFKPHAGHAVHNVERSLWLIKQVNSPYFRCTYDFSHLWLEGEDLVGSLEALLPVTPYIHVKDSKGTPKDHQYLLPGDGKTDYIRYFQTLKRLNYNGWVNVEVSAQIHRKPGYEPIPTAKLCYERLSKAFEAAKLERI